MSEPFRRHRMSAVTHLKQEPHPMTELIDTTEMYLKTVYELEEDGVPPLRARIVERDRKSVV